jgi:hypothetical protein
MTLGPSLHLMRMAYCWINAQFAKVLAKTFGSTLSRKHTPCYHATNEFGVSLSDERVRQQFFEAFYEEAWASLSTLPGTVEATQLLDRLGYRLICVSSMPQAYAKARLSNLQSLGMPIESVIATGRNKLLPNENSKKPAIDLLNPVFFVDDLVENFAILSSATTKVLIHKESFDSPNTKHLSVGWHDLRFDNLASFAKNLQQKNACRL